MVPYTYSIFLITSKNGKWENVFLAPYATVFRRVVECYRKDERCCDNLMGNLAFVAGAIGRYHPARRRDEPDVVWYLATQVLYVISPVQTTNVLFSLLRIVWEAIGANGHILKNGNRSGWGRVAVTKVDVTVGGSHRRRDSDN